MPVLGTELLPELSLVRPLGVQAPEERLSWRPLPEFVMRPAMALS
jgi:hypothetical protein